MQPVWLPHTSYMKKSLAFLLSVVFGLSGATALIYEVVWARLLQTTFGSTLYSTSTIFAAFLLGFAIGAFVLRNQADITNKPLVQLSLIQFCIGLYGIFISNHFSGIDSIYLSLPPNKLVTLVPLPSPCSFRCFNETKSNTVGCHVVHGVEQRRPLADMKFKLARTSTNLPHSGESHVQLCPCLRPTRISWAHTSFANLFLRYSQSLSRVTNPNCSVSTKRLWQSKTLGALRQQQDHAYPRSNAPDTAVAQYYQPDV